MMSGSICARYICKYASHINAVRLTLDLFMNAYHIKTTVSRGVMVFRVFEVVVSWINGSPEGPISMRAKLVPLPVCSCASLSTLSAQ